ncbi:MAG TPA: leishmanolysin-related zinc metalloendopeptidase, partial [Gemmatimonadales bacterium]|nr:leishmanolysin-related zinc metalloendopeptidase [Gemmatimonadales bacterium]
MDRHSAPSGRLARATRGRQWSRHFPVLTIVLGGFLAACSSSAKESDDIEPGPPENLVANSVTTQNATVGAAVAVRPAVKVTDADGIGVPGVQVVFQVTGGGGALTGGTIVTNATGVATVGSWTMGPSAGANTLTATATGLNGSPVTFTANASVSASNFNIKLTYLKTPTTGQAAAFEAARQRWQAVVIGDLSNVAITNNSDCGATVNETVDDLLILVELDSIDGPGQVLGSAGPCLVRSSNGLTIVGTMTFDTADIATQGANFQDIVLHEMGHVLGIGSLWQDARFNFVTSPCTSNPRYTGTQAIAAYTGSNGGGSATSIPLENFATGGCPNGTRDSHWEEDVFQSELMTGFISGTVRPLSLTTIRALADLGYTVDNSQADPFNINTQPTLRAGELDAGPRISLHGDVRQGPIYQVDDRPGANGAITRIR